MGNIAQRQGGLAFGIFKSIVLRIIEYYMEIKDYIDQRIHQQINWFERESKRNRHCYHTTKVLLTVTAAITPALASFIKDSTTVQIMVGIVSSLTAILANINGIFNFKDKYITFRDAAEYLKSEKLLYETLSGKYKDHEHSGNLFVDTIEQYILNLNSNWKKMLSTDKDTNH